MKHCKDSQLQKRNSPVEYSSTEYKHDIKESEGNMFNPIFEDNVRGQKHSGRCVSAEPELPSFRKPECVDQNQWDSHKIQIIVGTIIMKWHYIKELLKGTHNNTQHQNSTHPEISPIDFDGSTADQCTMSHGTYIHIVMYYNMMVSGL